MAKRHHLLIDLRAEGWHHGLVLAPIIPCMTVPPTPIDLVAGKPAPRKRYRLKPG